MAPCPKPVLLNLSPLSSPPTQAPETKSGVSPINQPSPQMEYQMLHHQGHVLAGRRFEQGLQDDEAEVTGGCTPAGVSADLSLVKSASSVMPSIGDVITYTLTLSNAGPNAADGVQISDQLPTTGTLVGQSASNGGYAGDQWTLSGSIDANSTETLELYVRIDTAGDCTNTAEVSMSNQLDPNSTPGDGEGDDFARSEICEVQAADIGISKTDNATAVDVGGQLTYIIQVSNTGTADANDVTVSDELPEGVDVIEGASIIAGSTVFGACDTDADGFTCVFDMLDGTVGGPDVAVIQIIVQFFNDHFITELCSIGFYTCSSLVPRSAFKSIIRLAST